MPILVSGSLAYDSIMAFPDSFKNHILPDQIHILNVSFAVDTMKREFGGCAGNIAYTLKLLGSEPIIFGALGSDGEEYLEHFRTHEIKTDFIARSADKLTAAAYITTDKDDNQICAFYSGPLAAAGSLSPRSLSPRPTCAIIAPSHREVMIRHAKECAELGIPIVFDPGQQLTALAPDEIKRCISQAAFLIGNDYELKLIEQKTGWGLPELLEVVPTIIVTMGERGSEIRLRDQTIQIEPCPPRSVEDPTGAGDAYRAGFFAAYERGLDLKTCGRVGSLAATYAVEHYGTQRHQFTLQEFSERYRRAYGEPLGL